MRMNFDGVFGEITTLPGCSQVAVSHAVYTPKYRRGKGFGTAALIKRIAYARDELGYNFMICTVRLENTAEIKVLAGQGFFRLSKFLSSNSGEEIGIFGRPL